MIRWLLLVLIVPFIGCNDDVVTSERKAIWEKVDFTKFNYLESKFSICKQMESYETLSFDLEGGLGACEDLTGNLCNYFVYPNLVTKDVDFHKYLSKQDLERSVAVHKGLLNLPQSFILCNSENLFLFEGLNNLSCREFVSDDFTDKNAYRKALYSIRDSNYTYWVSILKPKELYDFTNGDWLKIGDCHGVMDWLTGSMSLQFFRSDELLRQITSSRKRHYYSYYEIVNRVFGSFDENFEFEIKFNGGVYEGFHKGSKINLQLVPVPVNIRGSHNEQIIDLLECVEGSAFANYGITGYLVNTIRNDGDRFPTLDEFSRRGFLRRENSNLKDQGPLPSLD